MAARFRITCITKPDRHSIHEHILRIGGTESGGWTMDIAQAIKRMESGELAFFVRVGDAEVDVEVAKSAYGNKYLKTLPDATKKDNLLSLPSCPPDYKSI